MFVQICLCRERPRAKICLLERNGPFAIPLSSPASSEVEGVSALCSALLMITLRAECLRKRPALTFKAGHDAQGVHLTFTFTFMWMAYGCTGPLSDSNKEGVIAEVCPYRATRTTKRTRKHTNMLSPSLFLLQCVRHEFHTPP